MHSHDTTKQHKPIIHLDEVWNNLLIISGMVTHRARKKAMRGFCLPAMCQYAVKTHHRKQTKGI